MWGYRQSEIDDPGFFLSPRGRRNPQAELDATLAAFVTPSGEEPAQCRYPARFAWLKDQLQFDARLPTLDCPRYQAWRSQMHAQSVTLVFASYYMNNPASMYGHTFLKLNKSLSQDNPLLDYSANFAATVTTRSDILYAVYGLAGLYRGQYSTLPYYAKIQEYNHMESRDLWEYRLTLTPEETDRMVAHLWELGHTSIAYYFFNKNCSYQLLPVLEVARPSLNLVSGFWVRVVPADTLRRVTEEPGLVDRAVLRASHVHRMLADRAQLAPSEVVLASRLAKRVDSTSTQALQMLPVDRQVRVLDAAHDYFRYRVGFAREQSAEVQEQEQKLLLARSKLPPETFPRSGDVAPEIRYPSHSFDLMGRDSPELGTGPTMPYGSGLTIRRDDDVSPDQGHRSLRVSGGVGLTPHSPFEEVTIRGGLHDLMDAPRGYLPGNTLDMFHIRLRRSGERQTTYVQQASLVDLLSLPGWDPWVHSLSWRIRTGLETADDLPRDPENSLYYGLRFGSGLSLHSHLWKQELFYVLGDLDSGLGHVFNDGYRVGFGGSWGTVIHLAEIWRLQVEGRYNRYPAGQVGEAVVWRFIHAVDLSRRLQWRTTLERNNQHKELLLSLNLYL